MRQRRGGQVTPTKAGRNNRPTCPPHALTPYTARRPLRADTARDRTALGYPAELMNPPLAPTRRAMTCRVLCARCPPRGALDDAGRPQKSVVTNRAPAQSPFVTESAARPLHPGTETGRQAECNSEPN